MAAREKLAATKGARNIGFFLDLVRIVRILHDRLLKKPSWVEKALGWAKAKI